MLELPGRPALTAADAARYETQLSRLRPGGAPGDLVRVPGAGRPAGGRHGGTPGRSRRPVRYGPMWHSSAKRALRRWLRVAPERPRRQSRNLIPGRVIYSYRRTRTAHLARPAKG